MKKYINKVKYSVTLTWIIFGAVISFIIVYPVSRFSSDPSMLILLGGGISRSLLKCMEKAVADGVETQEMLDKIKIDIGHML